MSDVKDITPDIDRLDFQLDNLEDAIAPLLKNMEDMSSQLPLLDKAKLFSVTAYAIESMLFSSLKIQGIDAQNHAVFTELKRIQQYFAKIKAAENPQPQVQPERKTTVNQEATARVLKADLSDNKTMSSKLAEKIAEERAKALLKSMEKKRSAEESSQVSVASTGDAHKVKKPKSKSSKRRV